MQVTITVMYIQVIYFNNLLALSIGYKFGEYYFREYNSRCKATSFLSYLIENKYDGKEVALHRIYIFAKIRLNSKYLIYGGQSCNEFLQFKEKNS